MPDSAVDHSTIQEAFNNGEINKAHYDFLTKQLDELATPEGFELATMKRAYVGAFRPVVDPYSPEANSEAAAQTIQLEQSLSRKIEEMRASGRDPRDLFDPSKPEYIQTPFKLVPQPVPDGPESWTSRFAPTEGDRAAERPQAPDSVTQPGTPAPPEPASPTGSEAPLVPKYPTDVRQNAPRADLGTEAPMQAPAAELRAYHPPLSDAFKYSLHDAFTAIGMKPRDAAHLADALSNLAAFYPPVAYAFGADDFQRAAQRSDIPAAVWAAATLVPGLRGVGKRIFKITEPGLTHATAREIPIPVQSTASARAERTMSDLPPGGAAERVQPSKGKGSPAALAPRQAEAFASLGAARKRVTDAGLDHLTGRADAPEVLEAIKAGTAIRLEGGEAGFNTSQTFKDHVGHAPPDYEWHHIVPQHQSNLDAFGDRAIHSTSNMILLPKDVHLAISKDYSRAKGRGASGLTLRDRLKPLTFDEQHEEGIKMIVEALQAHGLAAP